MLGTEVAFYRSEDWWSFASCCLVLFVGSHSSIVKRFNQVTLSPCPQVRGSEPSFVHVRCLFVSSHIAL